MIDIDHNPHEKRPTNAVWWVLWIAIILSWIGYLYLRQPDWWSIALGAFSMGVLATWAIDITGNKTPGSWSGNPPRR